MTIADLLKEYEEENVLEVFIYRKRIIKSEYCRKNEEGNEDLYQEISELRKNAEEVEDYKELNTKEDIADHFYDCGDDMTSYYAYDNNGYVIDSNGQLATLLYITVIEYNYLDAINEADERLKIIDGTFYLKDDVAIVYVKDGCIQNAWFESEGKYKHLYIRNEISAYGRYDGANVRDYIKYETNDPAGIIWF